MSDPEVPAQQTPQMTQLPNGKLVMPGKCSKCKGDMSYLVPAARIFNGPDVSCMVFAHEALDECPHCHQKFLFLLNPFGPDGGLSFKWASVTPQNTSGIVGATEADMKRAAEIAKFSSDLKGTKQ